MEMEIELFLDKNAWENASYYFNMAKKFKKKAEKAKEALKKFEVREKREKKKRKVERKREWYERFRWSFTSKGKLIIAGRDARQNVELIRKYFEPKDLFLHADVHGAPVTLLKLGEEADELEKLEAAIFAACFSRAWRERLGYVDVFIARKEQVRLGAPPGMYMPKGSVMVYGEREWVKGVKLELYLGIKDSKLMIGAKRSIEKNCKVLAKLKPGYKKKGELLREILEKLGSLGIEVNAEELERLLPPGKSHIKWLI